MTILEIVVTFMGIVMSLGYYPQAYSIYKNKSAKNISINSYVIFSVGTFSWLLYGIYLMDWVIVISFILGVIGSWSVLGLALYYKNN